MKLSIPRVQNHTRGMNTVITLLSGKPFDYNNPEQADVSIEDIAHALSNICRFAGHVKQLYCPTPDKKILTADLRWVAAGDLKIGQQLIGFDENPWELGGAGKRRRRFRPSEVTHAEILKRDCFRILLETGEELTCSGEHVWLTSTKISRNQKWQSTEQLKKAVAAGQNRYLHKFLEPWQTLDTRDAGWLSGIFDGEGSFSYQRKGVQLAVAQNPGIVLDEIIRLLEGFGFQYRRFDNNSESSRVVNLQVVGGWKECFRLIGSLRPLRLLNKVSEGLQSGHLHKEVSNVGAPRPIKAIEPIGQQQIVSLLTSTHTYVCEGFGAYSSTALQHQATLPGTLL